MKIQKFIPEGWEQEIQPMTKSYLYEAMQAGQIVQGMVKKCDAEYNLYVDLGNDIIGRIPRAEVEAVNIDILGLPKPNICISKVNQYVQFKIRGLDEKNQYILSRKEVGQEVLQWIKTDLKEGDRVYGIVKSMQPYGAFVEIGGGIVGLLRIEDISIARIQSPLERLKIGQKVEVVVKSIDRERQRLLLSYKELFGTWEENIKGFEEGSTVIGIARETEKTKNGIFIELTPNLVGMAEYKEEISYGQKVNVYIKKIVPEKKKVKLVIV